MKIILFLMTAIVLLSCDPMRRIYMVNSSHVDAEITWKIKEDSLLCSPLFISLNPEVKFLVPSTHGKAINLSCGVGEWNPTALTNFVDDLESMELKWVGGSIKLTNADSIKNFLFHRRMGLDHGTIFIRFTDPVDLKAHNRTFLKH